MREYGFSVTRILQILSLYGRIRATENPYSRIFNAVRGVEFFSWQISKLWLLSCHSRSCNFTSLTPSHLSNVLNISHRKLFHLSWQNHLCFWTWNKFCLRKWIWPKTRKRPLKIKKGKKKRNKIDTPEWRKTLGVCLVRFSPIRTEYGEMRENTDQKNFEYGHFSPSACLN